MMTGRGMTRGGVRLCQLSLRGTARTSSPGSSPDQFPKNYTSDLTMAVLARPGAAGRMVKKMGG